ncbi:MAG: ferritin [bacterium]
MRQDRAMIGSKMNEALNAQIGREFGASYQYYALAAWFEEQGLPGFAKFFFRQGQEENEHALKIVHYLGEVGGHVVIPAQPQPKSTYESALAAIESFLAAEQDVTRAIYELVDLATAEKDHSAFEFLQWYVSEQREEVANATGLLDRARRFGEERVVLLDSTLS